MRYHVTYDITHHPAGLESDEILDTDRGGATAVFLGSLLYPPDGSYSAAFVSLDGRTGEPLDDAEVWKAWVMLAEHLSRSESLSDAKRELAEIVFENVRRATARAVEKEPA